jgi:hypothetical protein
MPTKTYTQTDFESALNQQILIQKVQSGEISLRVAQFEYGIPISTLCNHKNGKFSSQTVGSKTILTIDEERLLVIPLLLLSILFPQSILFHRVLLVLRLQL